MHDFSVHVCMAIKSVVRFRAKPCSNPSDFFFFLINNDILICL